MRRLALGLLLAAGCSTELGPVKCIGDDNCTTGTYCGSSGVCAALPSCDAGSKLCRHVCTATATDLGNCGTCGSVCSAPAGGSANCAAGRCDFTCGATLVVSGAGCVLPAPQHLTATGGGGAIALSWDTVIGGTGYAVLRASAASGPFAGAGTSTNNGFTDSGLADGATWFYEVEATGATGTGLPSTVSSATTSASPVMPVVTAPAFVTAGDTATATVPARTGMTYAWSVAGAGTVGSPGGTTGGGANTVSFSASAAATGALVLSCAEVNAAGHTSVAGSASVSIAPLPAPPAIKAAASMAPGSTGTASVTARAGMTYAWAVTSGSTTAPAGVTDSGTNTLTFTAATSGAVGLSCVETNAAGKSSAAATASVPIVSQSTLTVGGTGSGAGTMTSTGLSPELNCSWSGNATSGICAGTVLAGASVTLFTTASSGSRFVTWSNGCNTPTCSVTPSADLTLTATFVAQTTVTVTLAGTGSASGTVVSSPAGINCGPACSAGFDVTATGGISLTATGGSSATFSAFSGDCSGATCTLPSDGVAKSVTATFTGLNIWAGKKAAPAGNAAACSGVIDGILYSAEGYSAPGTTRAYHPADDSWTTGAAPSAAQASVYSAGGVIGGLLYCAGGCSTSSDCRVNPSSLLVAYDPKGDIWTTRASMPAAHALISVVGIGGLLYRVGGIGACPPCTPTTSVEAYDPAANAWTAKAPLPVARAQQTLVALGGLLYSIGGSIDWSSTTDTATADLLVFDPAAPTAAGWSQLASMGSTRLNPTCDALGGKIYCAGGYNGLPGTYPAPTEMYDPQTKLWTTLPNLPTPRTQAAGGTIGGLFYVVGGNNAAGLSSAVEVYTP